MPIKKTPLYFAIAFALLTSPVFLSAQNVVRTQTSVPTNIEIEERSFEVQNGRIALFLELDGESAAEVFTRERDQFAAANRATATNAEELATSAERAGARAAFTAAGALTQLQAEVIAELNGKLGSYVLYNARFAVNGIAALVPIEKYQQVRSLPGVRRVSPLVTQQVNAVSSIDFTGARTFWGTLAPDLNLRGSGIGVGVIDTGIDHIHTNFAGPGGASYALGATTVLPFPAPPTVPVTANFPTPKVVWGYDFVGDAYNAAGTTDAVLLPLPDSNSMDTNGHGTSVSSLIAGFGTNNDGTTYTGPVTRTMPNISAGQRISTGYAPQAALYAFRVFGTTGSTQVTTAALDSATAIYLWQSDTSIPWDGAVTGTVFNAANQPITVNYTIPQPPASPRLRVVNLSLGSNAGDIEESSAIAAQRSADAGLIVVMSAGNADDTYYITGSPGVATGGISVAASFNNQFPGGAATAPANAASTPPQPAISNAPILSVGNASFSNALATFPLTNAIYANPPFGGRIAPTPAGYTPPAAELGNLVTLLDPLGVDINLFSADAMGNLVVTMNPAANNVYAGRVVMLDRGGAVGFHQKGLAAQRAGAVGAIIVNNVPGAAGMAANVNLPTVTIPSVMIDQVLAGTFTLDGSLNTTVVPTRPNPTVRPSLQLALSPTNLALQDTMAAYSSRGPRRNDEGMKPDITGPAENVTVATATTGNGVGSFNGTSSAAPHTAGAMTLLRGLNPTWTNYELKALLLNSTAQNVFTLPGTSLTSPPTGQIWGMSRQGAGRWDLSRYSGGGSKVIMFGTDPLPTDSGAARTGSVNVSFGVVDVTGSTTMDRSVIVRNKSNVAQTYNIAFQAVSDTPGVSMSFPDGVSVTVPGLQERTFRIRMTANAADMRHARDLSVRPFQFITNTTLANRVPRQFLNEEAGYITLTPAAGGNATHRLSVQAFPRRASGLGLAETGVRVGTSQTPSFSGAGFNTGTNTAFVDTATFAVQPTPVDVVSFAKGFELSYESPTPATGVSNAQRAGDVQYVGISSDFSRRALPFDPATTNNTSTVLVFAVAARGAFDTVQSGFGAEYQIDIDTNNDNVADRMIRQFAFANGERTTVTTNIMLPVMSSVAPFTAGTSTGFALNVLSNVYTNLYNNSVVMIPVQVSGSATASMALTAATSRFNYRVRGLHRGLQISQTPWLSYDVARAGIQFQNVDEPSLAVPVNAQGALQTFAFSSNEANLAANASRGLLMLYPMNQEGSRTQVFPIELRDALFANGFED